ncbi:MAG: TIGR03435 family protein [Bryobacteraceae bacterium]
MKPFAAAIVFATAVLAQPLQFEVASIRPSAPFQPDAVALGLRMDGQQAHIVSFSLRDYIAMAYKIREGQVSGPDWLPDTRFDINATLPTGGKTDQIPDMLQALLGDRFQLKFHREKKGFDVYVLTRNNRPLALKPVTTDVPPSDGSVNVAAAGSGAGVSVSLGNGSSYTFSNNKFEGKRLSTVVMADQLERYMDRPMVDQSGLSGVYDMSLEITADDYRVMLIRGAKASGIVLPPQAQRLADGATTPSLFESLEKLGLHLEAKKIPLDVIIVDQISKTPSEN